MNSNRLDGKREYGPADSKQHNGLRRGAARINRHRIRHQRVGMGVLWFRLRSLFGSNLSGALKEHLSKSSDFVNVQCSALAATLCVEDDA